MKPLTALLLPLLLCACGSFHYDLAGLPFPVSAQPAPGDGGRPFETTGKSVLWVHGLIGESHPDVAALVRQQCGDCRGVTEFRVTVGASFHDWLVTHLTLGLVRMKTVTVSGHALGAGR